jgi:retinol dehydrogenase 12
MAMGAESGRTFLVTGGNTGIGLATATELARRGGRVYVGCRSEAKGSHAVASIVAATGNVNVSFLPLDLADLASVRACADEFLATGQPLHVLINNAGVAGRGGLTSDGFELLFGVNHLGHFALTTALLGCLVASAPARVVTVSSNGHFQAQGIDFTALRRRTRGLTGLHAYAVAKLCNVLFAQELGRRLDGQGVTTYALHPGVVASDIWRQVPWPVRPIVTARMLTPEQGAQTTLYCATSATAGGQSGRYYEDSQERSPSDVATEDLGKILWERSEAWTGS